MPRILPWALAAALFAWLATARFGAGMPWGGFAIPAPDIEIPALAALAVAVAALLLAWRAGRRAKAAQADLRQLTRSLDAALRKLAQRDEAALSIDDINRIVADELRRLDEQIDRRGEPSPPLHADRPSENVIPHPAAIVSKTPGMESERGPRERVVADALISGAPEISLRPIVSLGRSAAVGFDVFAHFGRDDADAFDVTRIRDPDTAIDVARFERMLFAEAAKTARRQLAGHGDQPSLHAPVSDALLGSPDDMAAVLEMTATYPAITRSVVLSVPLEAVARSAASLDRLTETGLSLAAEAGDDDALDTAALSRAGVRTLGVSAARLLGRRGPRPGSPDGQDIVDAAHDHEITIIAREVAGDDEAIGLIDLGIDLMSGPRFSGPLRLRSAQQATATQTAAE